MSNRVSYALVVMLLLLAAVLRFVNLATLPPGFSNAEIDNIRITETVRQGRVEVFYPLGGEGREGLYQSFLTAATSTGGGLLGYRVFSVWVGVITLALVYALGRRLYGSLAGLAAVGLLAVSMYPIVLSRIVAPETMLPLYVTAVMLALAYSLAVYGEHAHFPTRTAAYAALGILLGLGFYLHPISIVVTLMSMLFIVTVVFTRRTMSRRTLSYTWFAVVIMIVIATPYVISSLQRPELAAAGRLLVNDPDKSLLDSLTSGLNGWFFVGDNNPQINLPGRPLIDLFSGLLVIVGLVVALRGWRTSRYALLLMALVFLAPPALLAPGSPNFLAFAPLVPLIALLFGLGVSTIYSSLPSNRRIIGAVGLATLLVFNLVWVSRDLRAWSQLPEMQVAYNVRLGQLAHHLDLTAAFTPTVICTSDLKPQTNPVNLTDTQLLALMMHRQDVTLRYADCGSALILTGGGSHEQIILVEDSGLEGVNPYLRGWLEHGEIVNQPSLPLDSVIMLDVSAELANHIGAFMTTAPVAYDLLAATPGEQQVVPPPIRLGGNLAFLGYDRTWADSYAPGDVVPVITYWRVDGTVPDNLRLFTHILADPITVAAQSDPISVLPEQLRPRDVFIQVSYVMLPRTMPRGLTYGISVGAYESNTQNRLPVFEGEEVRGNRLFVGQINVREN